jgi:hypothetical protein
MNSRVKFTISAMSLFWVKMAFAGQLGVVDEGSIIIPERPTFSFTSGSGSTSSSSGIGADPVTVDNTNAELEVNVLSPLEINNDSASSAIEPIEASLDGSDSEVENLPNVTLEGTLKQTLLMDINARIGSLTVDRGKNIEFQRDNVENVTLDVLQSAQLKITFEDGELTAALTDINKNAELVSTGQNFSVERMTPGQVERVLSLIDIILKDTSLSVAELRNVVSLQNYILSAR